MEIEKLSNFDEPKDEGISIKDAIGSIKEIINVISQGKNIMQQARPQQPQPQQVEYRPQPKPQPQPTQQPQPQPVAKPQPATTNQNTEKIISALELVKTFKGDIKISELQVFLNENQAILSKFF